MKKFNYLLIVFALTLLLPHGVRAAEVYFETTNNTYKVGEEFVSHVYLNTQGELVNAIEGEIVFPQDLLRVKDIRNGNSLINFWINGPKFDGKTIVFSGITPGGIIGKEQKIFSVVFEAVAEGKPEISFKVVSVLKNDASGTKLNSKVSNLHLEIKGLLGDTEPQSEADNNPPEEFLPFIGRDKEIYDDKYFIVFSTQDKGVGVDRYEVKEGFWGDYLEGKSPYLLVNQKLDKKIHIKALDKSGNERVVTLKPANYQDWYKDPFILGIIILAISSVFYIRKRWSEHLKQVYPY